MLILLQHPSIYTVKPRAVKKPYQTTTINKGKGKANNTFKLLTSQKSTRNKATLAKTIPSTSRKAPTTKPTKPTKKSRAPINATTREINIYIPTVKARYTRTLLYKRTGTRRQTPRGILLTLTYSNLFTNTFIA